MNVHASARQRPLILHVSGDFPDPVAPFKTPVIRAFITMSAEHFDHHVISINRQAPQLGAIAKLAFSRRIEPPFISAAPFDFGTAVSYLAPGRGLLHETRLKVLGEWLIAQIKSLPRQPDLLMAHKLTIEGIAVSHAAKALGLPYALTIQGNTDRKIIALRPDLRDTFRQIYKGARQVLTFTPIAKNAIEELLGRRKEGIALIPCPTELDSITPPQPGGNGLISVFHLKNHKVKNLQGMVRALKRAPSPAEAPRLAIIGGGSDDEQEACRTITKGCATVTFEGALNRDDVSARMNAATALVQPSLTESFGLVFVEALFAGLPIIYPAGTGIDGYFDNAPFALRVDPRSPSEIFAAMTHAVAEERVMKVALADWQLSAQARRFTREKIRRAFNLLLERALSDPPETLEH